MDSLGEAALFSCFGCHMRYLGMVYRPERFSLRPCNSPVKTVNLEERDRCLELVGWNPEDIQPTRGAFDLRMAGFE